MAVTVIESPEIGKHYDFLFVYLAETEERRMTHLQETLIGVGTKVRFAPPSEPDW